MKKLGLFLLFLTIVAIPNLSCVLSGQNFPEFNFPDHDSGPDTSLITNAPSRGCGEDFDGLRTAEQDDLCLKFFRSVAGNLILIGDFLSSHDRRGTLGVVLGQESLPLSYINDTTEFLVPFLGNPVSDPIGIFEGQGPFPSIEF